MCCVHVNAMAHINHTIYEPYDRTIYLDTLAGATTRFNRTIHKPAHARVQMRVSIAQSHTSTSTLQHKPVHARTNVAVPSDAAARGLEGPEGRGVSPWRGGRRIVAGVAD